MDRPVDASYRRKRRIKRIVVAMIAVTVVAAVANWGLNYIRPSVKRRSIRTAVVEIGDVIETITASGTVEPTFEEVVTSPVSTTVLKILKQPGDILAPNDSLLVLDTGKSALALSTIDEQILLKQNQKEKIAVDLDIELNDLNSRLESRKLHLEASETRYRLDKRLHDLGGASLEQLQQSNMAADIARIDVEQMKQSKENAKRLSRNRLDALDLEISILEKERTEIRKKLELARMIMNKTGVLTWIVEEEGVSIGEGEIIARIADLTSFRIRATVSDIHASRLNVGLPVIVRINRDINLDGVIRSILPNIDNGIVTFMVDLEEDNHESLRSNLRAEVFVVTDEKYDVARVKKGPFAQGNGVHDVFVIQGDRAYRREASFGISGFDFYEVADGLDAGDEVIISDMQDRLYARELVIR